MQVTKVCLTFVFVGQFDCSFAYRFVVTQRHLLLIKSLYEQTALLSSQIVDSFIFAFFVLYG